MASATKHQRKKLAPLKVACTSSDCDAGLHCFSKSRQMADADRGKCRSCGVDLIDWPRVHAQQIEDAAFTIEALKSENVRHHFWHKEIDQTAEFHARRKGSIALREAVKKRLTKSVGPAEPPYDGRQTGLEGNIIFYAQHATACCCRKCIEYWHGIPKGVQLTDTQIEYFEVLVMAYVLERMPNLTDQGEKIPSRRRTKPDMSQ